MSTTEVTTDVTTDAAAADRDGRRKVELVESLRYVADTAAEEIRTYLERYGENPDPKLIDDALREMESAKRAFRCLITTGKSPEEATDDEHRRVLAEVLMDKVDELANDVEPHMTRYVRDPDNVRALCDAANIVRDLWRLFEALFAVAHPGERWRTSGTSE